jgi:hypothetical protein
VRRIKSVKGSAYSPETYGLLQSRRRLTRVTFSGADTRALADPERFYRQLLPEVFGRMRRIPHAPMPMPERVRVSWKPDERAFVLHAPGMTGFEVLVQLETVPESDETILRASGRDVETLHGSALPRVTS